MPDRGDGAGTVLVQASKGAALAPREALRSRPPDFAPSSETPGGYVGQAVLESWRAE